MSRRGLMAAALLLVTTACTSGNSSTFANRFITNGKPAVNLGGPEVPRLGSALKAARESLAPAPGSLPRSSPVPPTSSSGLSSLEATSPRLQKALTALALDPTADRYLAVASAYTAEGIRDKAFDYLNDGLKGDRRNPALHDAVARLWRDWGFPDKALTSAHRAVYYAPDSPEAYNTLGTVLWALGQRDEATRTFEQATVLDPGAWYAWQNLCEAALTAGQTRDATTLCRRAAKERRAAKDTRR